jgi:hypothetical protein
MRSDQRENFIAKRNIVAGFPVEESCSVAGDDIQCLFKQLLQLLDTFRCQVHGLTACPEFAQQEGAGKRPVALDGCRRDVERHGSRVDLESTEIAQLDDACLTGGCCFQPAQRVVQRKQVEIPLRFRSDGFVQRDPQAKVALQSLPCACMVNEDAPDGLCGDGEEVRAALPLCFPLADQLQEGFVHQQRGLQRMARSLPAHGAIGYAVKFAVDLPRKFADNIPVALAEFLQQRGDFGWGRWRIGGWH